MFVWQDILNGSFEIGATVSISFNCLRVRKDKAVKGINAYATLYFSLWGMWNLFYYSHLDQWFSFLSGGTVVLINSYYVWLLIYYTRRERSKKT